MPLMSLRGAGRSKHCCPDGLQTLHIIILDVNSPRKPAMKRSRPTAGHCIDTSRTAKSSRRLAGLVRNPIQTSHITHF